MPDPYFHLDAFPRCPTCGLEAHTLTFSPAVDSENERVLTNFRWRGRTRHNWSDCYRQDGDERQIARCKSMHGGSSHAGYANSNNSMIGRLAGII
jgi:hypothetical protein